MVARDLADLGPTNKHTSVRFNRYWHIIKYYPTTKWSIQVGPKTGRCKMCVRAWVLACLFPALFSLRLTCIAFEWCIAKSEHPETAPTFLPYSLRLWTKGFALWFGFGAGLEETAASGCSDLMIPCLSSYARVSLQIKSTMFVDTWSILLLLSFSTTPSGIHWHAPTTSPESVPVSQCTASLRLFVLPHSSTSQPQYGTSSLWKIPPYFPFPLHDNGVPGSSFT